MASSSGTDLDTSDVIAPHGCQRCSDGDLYRRDRRIAVCQFQSLPRQAAQARRDQRPRCGQGALTRVRNDLPGTDQRDGQRPGRLGAGGRVGRPDTRPPR